LKITAWRIFEPKHSATAFTGDGASLYGGRWNSKGVAVVYTAAHCSLAALEMLVHFNKQRFLKDYVVAEVSFDKRLVQSVQTHLLPAQWRADPPPPELQAFGDQWVAGGRSAVLKVPSSIIDAEFNYLLNPAHLDFSKISIGVGRPFSFDPRLLN
jgi:RES domain-containing protein